MSREEGKGGDIHSEGEGVLLILEAIGDSCGEASIFLYPALGSLHIDLQLPNPTQPDPTLSQPKSKPIQHTPEFM